MMHTIEKNTDFLTGSEMIAFTHQAGFRGLILPKPGFSKKFAGILVPIGSVQSTFDTPEGSFSVPAGSAHYMEHCIFSKTDKTGLLTELSALGANVNAYTSHTHTLYYFTCVDHFYAIFEKYLGAILHPYIEPDRIESERDIILQELDMYEDDPENNAYKSVLESLYASHPIRFEIGGTKESVADITSEHLKFLQKNYYTPASVQITIAGDVSQEETGEVLTRAASGNGSDSNEVRVVYPEETPGVTENEKEISMDISTESFLVGIKNPFAANRETFPEDRAREAKTALMHKKGGQLFFEMLMGKTSGLYETLYNEGLINDSFGFHYVYEDTYSYLIAGGESPDPASTADRVINMLEKEMDRIVDSVEFQTKKRSSIGKFVRALDSVEGCGRSAASAAFAGIHLFDIPQIYAEVDAESIRKSLEFVKNPALRTRTLIRKAR